MKRLLNLIGEQSSGAIFLESLLFAIGVGVLDYVSGYEVSMFVFYGISILAAAWWCDRKSAFALAAVCALLWVLADALAGHFYLHEWIRVWEPLARFGYFGFVAWAGSALKRQHLAVQSRIALLEHSQRLERQIIEISEREQRRLGRDLHDGLCQYLAAVGCTSASLRSDLAARGLAEEAAVAAEVTELLEQGVGQIRDLARGLMPVQMYEAGLAAALEQLAASVSRIQNTTCRLQDDGQVRVEAPSVAIHLYRIAQEAIHNAIRHGSAHTIEMSLQKRGSMAKLSIQDDGRGVSHTLAQPQGGMGLSVMKYRSRLIGGNLEIDEPKMGGTIIRCAFPLISAQRDALHQEAIR
jgi:signal transduction histidine kinase